MSKLANALREKHYHNNWELLVKLGGQDDVAIEYTARAPGRLGWTMTNKTDVWSPRPHSKLDEPKGMSRTYAKTFLGVRKESWPVAIAWAIEQFGHVFVPSPFGGYLPRHLVEKARRVVAVTSPVRTSE